MNELSRWASSVMESPGRRTWVRVQTIALLETSLSATKTFSDGLSFLFLRWAAWLSPMGFPFSFSDGLSFLLYCGLPITISGNARQAATLAAHKPWRITEEANTSQVDTVGAAYSIERKKKPRADPDAYLSGAASREAIPFVRDPDSYLRWDNQIHTLP
jgi:hypothetical protein